MPFVKFDRNDTDLNNHHLLALDVRPRGDFDNHSLEADAISLARFSLVSPLHLLSDVVVVVVAVAVVPFDVAAGVVDVPFDVDDASPAPLCCKANTQLLVVLQSIPVLHKQ